MKIPVFKALADGFKESFRDIVAVITGVTALFCALIGPPADTVDNHDKYRQDVKP